MKNKYSLLVTTLLSAILFVFAINSCKKSLMDVAPSSVSGPSGINSPDPKNLTATKTNFNLNVKLRSVKPGEDRGEDRGDDQGDDHGERRSMGHIRFRQDEDAAKIITLDVLVHGLEPNHSYQLQRAVDTNLDGNCTSTAWLTLGKGLIPQSILTDSKGKGEEDLWRDVSSVASGTTFDIHFQVIDEVTLAVVLTSDCYQFTVR